MRKPFPDYTETQTWIVAASLKERFRKHIDIREARLSSLQVQSDYERNNKQEQDAAA